MWDHLTSGLSLNSHESADRRGLTVQTVGVYSLTAEEYEGLPIETVQVVGKQDQYIVTIEMFHQLHCLVSVYSTN